MARTAQTRRSIAETVTLAFGVVYILIGLVGFAVTGGVEFAGREGERLLGVFEVNPMHNVVHLLVGVALVLGALTGAMAARIAATAVGVTYLAVGVLGLFAIGSDANVLALNAPDNMLHLLSGAVLLWAGLAGGERVIPIEDTASRSRSRTGGR